MVTKVGLDGHDRGAHVIARAFRDAGFEVIYSGLHKAPEEIVQATVQEDVDVLGISILSGAHDTLVPKIMDGLEEYGAKGGHARPRRGVIPEEDRDELKELGLPRFSAPEPRSRRRSNSSAGTLPSDESDDKSLLEDLLTWQHRALARAISKIENRSPGYRDIVSELYTYTGAADVIRITGSPGAGKSTLVDKLAEEYRDRGETIGVIAIDPSSPFTGGAVLGDRIRMASRPRRRTP